MTENNKPNTNTPPPGPATKEPAPVVAQPVAPTPAPTSPPASIAPIPSSTAPTVEKSASPAAQPSSIETTRDKPAPAVPPKPAPTAQPISPKSAPKPESAPANTPVINTPPNEPKIAILQDALSMAEEQTELGSEAPQTPAPASPKIPENNELPHQPDNLKPEEIVEHEQEPPKETINIENKNLAPDKLETIIKEKQDDLKHHPSPAEEDRYHKHHHELKQKIKAVKSAPARKATEKPFAIRYIQKLKDQLKTANAKRQQQVETNLKKIMDYAWQTQKVTNDDVERITGVKDRQAQNYLNKLTKQGKLIRFGQNKNTFYKPIKK